MARLEILKYPDPRLKMISKEVTEFNPELRALLDSMIETMYSANGVGLAAPQVNRQLRAFVIDLGSEEDQERKLYEFINPRLSNGKGKISFQEGCLSVPGVSESVSRKETIEVEYQDRSGKKQRMLAEGLLSVAIQHENDHLDGVLFVERLSLLKRKMIQRKLAKAIEL